MTGTISALLVMALTVFATHVSAQSAENPNFPVLVIDREEGVIAIAGEIDFRTPLAFERVLSAVPNASILILDSPGGMVHSALSIGARVQGLGLSTLVLENSECLSACALVFFAGRERLAYGDLGVHQISSPDGRGSLVAGQYALADVIEALDKYNVPSELVALMLRTPPDDIYVLSPDEKNRFGLMGAAPSPNRQTPPSDAVDLSNPETWRGNVVTGQLVASGKKWFAELYRDGTTTFQFASGKLSKGHYYVSKNEVCFKLDQATDYACRRPVRSPSGVLWYDEDGNFQCVIVTVDRNKVAAVTQHESESFDVSDYIAAGDCALVVASRRTLAEAKNFVVENVPDRRFLKGFRSNNGWIAISIGTLKPDEVDTVVNDWKQIGKIPADSYCSIGRKFIGFVDLGFE